MSEPKPVETEESGPISNSLWDTRTRDNSRWCEFCEHWLSLSAFAGLGSLDDRLAYHQSRYCKASPFYDPSE